MKASRQAKRPALKAASSESVRDKLILQNLRLVKLIARRMNLPAHVDLEDLEHTGILGLFDAANKYDNNKQVTFQSYAKHRIRGAILDSLRDNDWASRSLRKCHKRLEEVTREFSSTEQTPNESEVAEKMGMDVRRWRKIGEQLRMTGLLSASRAESDRENRSDLDALRATNELNPHVLTEKRELRELLSGALKQLPNRHRQVITAYYVHGRTLREIGDTLQVNESRAGQIRRAALRCMARTLNDAGIHSGAHVV